MAVLMRRFFFCGCAKKEFNWSILTVLPMCILVLNATFGMDTFGGDPPNPHRDAPFRSSIIDSTLPWVDVRSHGATSNYKDDDDAARINTAMDYAVKAGVRTVYIPEGTWDVSTTIKIPSNITLLLSDRATIRLKAGARLEYGIVTNRNSAMGDSKTDTGIRIIGGTIDGNGVIPTSGENRGIFFCKSSFTVIENVVVKDTNREGIRIHSIDKKRYSEHVVVRSCTVIRKQDSGGNIMFSTHLGDPRNSTGKSAAMRYCRVEGCYSSGGSHGIIFFNVQFAIAINNICEGNTHRGIILSPSCEDCLVTGNIVRGAGSTGIHLAYKSKRCVISNNIVVGTLADGSGLGIEGQGIKAYAGFQDLIITGNQVSTNATDGIALEGGGESRGFVISNNISSKNNRDGIRIFAGKITLGKTYDITNGSISGNICRDNRESGIRMASDHPSVKAGSISVMGNSFHRNGKWGIHMESSKSVSLGTNNYDSNGSGDENLEDVQTIPSR